YGYRTWGPPVMKFLHFWRNCPLRVQRRPIVCSDRGDNRGLSDPGEARLGVVAVTTDADGGVDESGGDDQPDPQIDVHEQVGEADHVEHGRVGVLFPERAAGRPVGADVVPEI